TCVTLLKVVVGYGFGHILGFVRFSLHLPTLKAVWRYAFPVSIAWMFGVFVHNADQFILSLHIDAAEFAFYAIGCLVIPPILIFEHSVTRVMIPQLSASFSQGEGEKAQALYRDAVKHLAFLLIPAVTGLIVFAEPIITLLFTDTYARASNYLELFALSYLFLMIPYDAVPRAKGQANWILRTFVVFSVISLALAYFLTHEFGPYGALAALLLSRLL